MSEETEVTGTSQSDDYWDTYQEFFLNPDAIEIEEELVNLNLSGLDCYHDTVSDNTPISLSLSVNDTDHYHYVDDPYSLSVWAYNTEHAHVADEVGLQVVLSLNDTDHYHYAWETGIASSAMLYPDRTVHEHEAEAPSLTVHPSADIAPADVDNELTDTGWSDITLVFNTPIYADDTEHYTLADGNNFIYIKSTGTAVVYPNDGEHGVSSDEVGAFTTKEVMTYVASGTHLHTVDAVPEMAMVYNLTVEDCEHAHLAERVSPTFILADGCSHGHTADLVWGWINRSEHALITEEMGLKVTLGAQDCIHYFAPSAQPSLGLSIVAAGCYHSLFTPDTLDVNDTYHDVVSDEIEGNTQYRRLYV